MRATERNLSHDEADKIELICKNIQQQTDYDWTEDMKKLSPGAKFILYEEVAARFPHYLSSNMHSKVDTVKDFLIKLGIKPPLHLLEIIIFSVNHTANIFEVICTVFDCVPISTVHCKYIQGNFYSF